MKKRIGILLAAAIIFSLSACSASSELEEIFALEEELDSEVKGATEITAEINRGVYKYLDFEDTQEAEFAKKGLIAAPETLELKNKDGKVVWSQEAYAFLDEYEEAPDTVNPSLWENTKNNHQYGLFEVADGIYQVRGYDMTNLTLIEGDTGWIVFDPLMSVECMQAAMQLVEENLGKKPVRAVIISHSHVDHFGGIQGIMSKDEAARDTLSIEEQLASGKIPIIGPEGMAEAAVSENIYAGNAMTRRSQYQYGAILDINETGRMGIGIGMGQSAGISTFIAPTYEIKNTCEKITIDGVELEFQLTPGTEAPAEMNTWIPSKKALWVAENCTATLHNLYTLRGAQVRDGAAWAKYIAETITLYGDEAEVTFQSHNWPHWGNDVINEYLENTAAVYKYINDKTMEYINLGYTSDEISNMIKLPEKLEKVWYTRQYYGTVAHNAKAVYQKYMGWYDGNPVNLNPLEPSESAKKWVEYLGDTKEVLRMAKEDFEAGEYQWVAEITNVLVYADPENEVARLLCADALEQLGYQAESGAWRNVYLSAAKELREGNQNANAQVLTNSGELMMQMTPEMAFGMMGIQLDKEAMEKEDFKINFVFPDVDQKHMIHIKNGVLIYYENTLTDDADLTITCPKNAVLYILAGKFEELEKSAKFEGDLKVLKLLMENIISYTTLPTAGFNIVEP